MYVHQASLPVFPPMHLAQQTVGVNVMSSAPLNDYSCDREGVTEDLGNAAIGTSITPQ